ncbi:MAG: hypothetical protein R3B84_01525 [Zavarzinella sp.]
MPDFIIDPAPMVYIILVAFTVILAALAFRRQTRRDLIFFGFAAGILLTWFLLDRAYESGREQVNRKISEMAEASQSNDYKKVFDNISPTFKYKALNKDGLFQLSQRGKQFLTDGVELWGMNRQSFKQINPTTIEMGFNAQGKGMPQSLRYCVGVFQKEADNEWRMTSFRLYNPVQKDNGEEDQIPGF